MAIGADTIKVSQGEFRLHQLDEAIRVLDHIAACMQKQDYLHRDVFGVQLALEEAINNALRHGNGLDPSKSVRVTFNVETEVVYLEVKDEGDGFSCSNVCDPTLDENIDKPGGRGLLFIRNFMTSVEYNDAGNHVRMLKRRTIVQSSAQQR